MGFEPTLLQRCVAEGFGTFFLVFFGTGCVASAVATNSFSGLWQVASVWGFGVCMSIYMTAGISGAHLNPAVSLALTVRRSFPAAHLLPYMAAQLVGSVLAGVLVLLIYGTALHRKKLALDEEFGTDGWGEEHTAMAFGEVRASGGRSSCCC